MTDGNQSGPSTLELMGIGGTAAGCIAVGVGVGYWIGFTFRTGPVAIFIGLGAGIVAAVLAAYAKIKKYL